MQALNRPAQKLNFGVLLNQRFDQAIKVIHRNHCQPILACAVLLALVLSPATMAFAADPIGVFVSILPQKQFVERIGGDAVKVDVMVRPGESPATYDPTPQQMVVLAGAAAYFRIGVPFETVWIPKIQSTQPHLQIVDTRAGIQLQPMGKAGHPGDHGHDTPPGSGGALDPHIWTSPPLVKQQVATIRDALIALRPAERVRFEKGYAAYAAELDALDAELRQVLAGKTERRFMVFHPSWGYLAHSYGLEQIPIEAEGKDPGPKALAALIERAKADGVRVIFVQRQFGRSAADAVAQAIGGEVVEIDPLAEDFLANTRTVAQTLARTLK
ncbi:MAG TPA: ABC transporter substrate-binding protein [Gammaproteobacteria bacterium]|nr:ABC transporter substrate-binding protein [Gammaproteobacteria bacterium]